MKKLILIITFMLCIPLNAQTDTDVPDIFVRVYDLEGKKMGKGEVLAISDSTLILNRNGRSAKFLYCLNYNLLGSINYMTANQILIQKTSIYG